MHMIPPHPRSWVCDGPLLGAAGWWCNIKSPHSTQDQRVTYISLSCAISKQGLHFICDGLSCLLPCRSCLKTGTSARSRKRYVLSKIRDCRLLQATCSNRRVPRHSHNQACMWAYWSQAAQHTTCSHRDCCHDITAAAAAGPLHDLQDNFDWAKPLEESQPVQR